LLSDAAGWCGQSGNEKMRVLPQSSALIAEVGKLAADWLDCNQLLSDEKMTRHGSTRTF
jgi:hypothetical protein